jgi:cytidyltransferase-like protein
MKTIVLVTGGFDPLHSGHIAYFKAAKKLGDELHVGLNSDEWLTRKKGRPFMSFKERVSIIDELSIVDKVISFDDSDDSACGAIYKTMATNGTIKIIFANGGDRTNTTTPEFKTYGDMPNVEFAFGVGGEDKKNSSSWILKEWSQPTTERAWGRYTVLDKGDGWATKKLAFDVGKSLSDQRHFKRSEHWHVVEGTIHMALQFENGDIVNRTYYSGDSIDIPVNTWHKAANVGDITAKVVEVWLGSELSEEDIERRD